MMKLGTYNEAVAALPQWTTASIQGLGFERLGGDILSCDGVVGPKTLAGVYLIPEAGDLAEDTLVGGMLAFVRQGRQETPGMRNNEGVDVAYMWYGDGPHPTLRPGPWCAATVSRALINSGVIPGWRVNVGARRTTDYFRDRKRTVKPAHVLAGDLVSWEIPRADSSYGGHIGVVCYVTEKHVYTIEGNGGARHGRVRIYVYERPAMLYGRGKHPIWGLVRPV